MSAEQIVQEQVNAYNARDIEKFISCHHSKIELYTFPEKEPFAIGQSRLKEIYHEVFENSPNLHTEILHRITIGNKVIDHEIVTGRKGVERLEIVAIYEIENGLISKARFIRK